MNMKLNKLKLGGYTLCPPTYIYLVLSLISFIMVIASNLDATLILLFIVKVLIWVFILNLMCANGLVMLAWFFVLFPFIMTFVYIVWRNATMMDDDRKETNIIIVAPAAPAAPAMPAMPAMPSIK